MSQLLRRESRGADVTRLQTLLNARLRPSPNLQADGAFGPRTEAAVRQFQAQAGLAVDGIVGPNTWSALNAGGAGDVQLPPTTQQPGQGSATPAAPWMAIAQGEIGVQEIAGPRDNQRIVEYHATTGLRASDDETPWCSSFVNWCLRQAGIRGTNSAGAASWLNWGQTTTAQPGAITVLFNAAASRSLTSTGNHVGFLVEETSTHYVLLGGNQSNQVKVSRYPKHSWRLRGYRWPVT